MSWTFVILAVALSAAGGAWQLASTPAAPPATELAYDTFCKKEEREKRRLFRSATAEQKAALARTQIERWREVNRARLSKDQLTVLQDLWTMATPELFAATEEGRAKLAAFEARADPAFAGRELDQLSPYGPCIALPAAK
jgi:hypothetical protein